MEKLLDQDARIRRAEEIYLRRQNLREKTKRATVSVSEPRNFKLLKRIILQIVICVLLYFIFYLINTTNYSFSEVTLSKTDELISNDEDFAGICTNIIDSINKYIEKMSSNGFNMEEANKLQDDTVNSENTQNNIENKIDEANNNSNHQSEENQNSETNENGKENQNINSGENNNQDLNEENVETNGEQLGYVNINETDRIKNTYSFIIPTYRRH